MSAAEGGKGGMENLTKADVKIGGRGEVEAQNYVSKRQKFIF